MANSGPRLQFQMLPALAGSTQTNNDGGYLAALELRLALGTADWNRNLRTNF
jgi:hypothetical protein